MKFHQFLTLVVFLFTTESSLCGQISSRYEYLSSSPNTENVPPQLQLIIRPLDSSSIDMNHLKSFVLVMSEKSNLISGSLLAASDGLFLDTLETESRTDIKK